MRLSVLSFVAPFVVGCASEPSETRADLSGRDASLQRDIRNDTGNSRDHRSDQDWPPTTPLCEGIPTPDASGCLFESESISDKIAPSLLQAYAVSGAARPVAILFRKRVEFSELPSCVDAQSCMARSALVAQWTSELLAIQRCTIAKVVLIGGKNCASYLISQALVSLLSEQQATGIASLRDVARIHDLAGNEPPP